ncbi:MAG: hypothetical protein L6265_12475, partial [Thermoplasmatales archaeon]|nr:hypothetical protein [Candidatus Methanoperedenaceae archaeon]MCG2827397.1 hypothetical protein [Thermoplasmatales archaeon]
MRCRYLSDGWGCLSCTAGKVYDPSEEELKQYCQTAYGCKKCSRYKEQLRVERAPLVIKFIAFFIPIISWMSLLSILMSVNNIAINDFGNNLLVITMGS